MVYLILFLLEILVLYFLSRKLTKKLGGMLSTYLFAVLFLPGTFIHEIAHFLTALILFVPVGQPEFFPEREGKIMKLGSVPIGKADPFRRTIIGVAPVILGIVLIVLGFGLLIKNKSFKNFWVVLAAGYGVFEIGNTMFSSREDVKDAWIVALVLALVAVGLYLLGVRFSFVPDSTLFRKIATFMAVPIVIDIIVLGGLRLLTLEFVKSK